MSDEQDQESKTEEPTEKKLFDALERGDVPVSREIPILASLLAMLIVCAFVLPSRAQGLIVMLVHFMDDPAGWTFQRGDDVVALGGVIAHVSAMFLVPVVAIIMVFGLTASLVQNPPRIVMDRIAPDLSRISPRRGFSRIFGPRGWTEFFKSVFKILAVGVVTTIVLAGQKHLLATAMFADASDLPQRILNLCVKVIAAIIVATLVIASADLVWARILWRRDQRMSRHEIKEELRQVEGDRLMKARLRSIRLDRSRKRMLAAVPKATMVIVNPTHYAVALRYVRAEGGAPIVLAKGVDLIALKIREIAESTSIPIVEDKPLARSLYDAVAVDSAIPPEFYRAVAEIVHLIQDRRSSWPITRNRMAT